MLVFFAIPEMTFIICDLISNYKLTKYKHILMVSTRVVSHQSQCFVPSVTPSNQSFHNNF